MSFISCFRRINIFHGVGMFGCYGFVRGWKADYKYDHHRKEISPVNYSHLHTDKYVEKFMRSIFNAAAYSTFGIFYYSFHLLCRFEIYLTHKNPYDFPFVYTETGGHITLPPIN